MRTRNKFTQYYKVYIKQKGEPKIPKREAEEKSEYAYVNAYNGNEAMTIFDNVSRETNQNYFAWFYRVLRGGESIEKEKCIN